MFCQLHMCAKTYQSIVYENGTKTFQPRMETPLNSSALDVDEISNAEACELGNCTTPPEIGRKYMRLTPDNSTSLPVTTRLAMNKMDFLNLGAYFVELFSVDWILDDSGTGQSNRIKQPWFVWSGTDTPMVAQLLAESPDMNETIRNIADSMTESLRTGANGTTVPGRSYSRTTYIQVEWAWLALPVSLMVMSIILLMIVIMQTHVKGAAVWKSSSLALLFHQLDGWDVPAGSVTDRHTLERMARKMKGQLRDDIGHPAFVRAAGTNRMPEAEPLAHHKA